MPVKNKQERKNELEVAVRTVSAIIIILLISAVAFFSIRFLRCFSSAKRIPKIPAYEQMQFTIYGSSEGTVSGKFILLNTAGKEVSAVERSWAASELTLVYLNAKFNDSTYFFPYKITGGEDSKISGTPLFPYFMEEKECLLLSNLFSKKQKKALYNIGVFVRGTNRKGFSKYCEEKLLDLSVCVPGKEYAVSVSQSGGIRLYSIE